MPNDLLGRWTAERCVFTDPLNDRQLVVLRWVADGCPAGEVAGSSYKHTARALHDRKLVVVSKRGGGWAASLTERGRYYLDHGEHPPSESDEHRPWSSRRAPAARTAGVAHEPDVRKPGDDTSGNSVARSGLHSTQQPRRSPTEQLVADVVAAGGRLELEPDRRGELHYKMSELVRNANRFGKAPPGKRLKLDRVRHAGDEWMSPSRYVVVLEEGPVGADAELQPVPVPDEVRRYHPVVGALRKDRKLASSPVNARRWRILHALAVEAEQRGYTVKAHKPRPVHDHRSKPEQWDLLLTKDGETISLKLSEELDRVEHIQTTRELAEQKRNTWSRMSTHDTVPSGRLRIDVGGLHNTERRSFWADRSRWTLEDKLPEVLREVAVRIDELRRKRDAQARAEAAYREAVERERSRARERAGESHRWEILDKQLQRWREAAELRAYAADVAARIAAAERSAEADAEAVAAARRWLEWIEEQSRRRDPLTELPAWPAVPDLLPWELEKFMKRVSQPLEMSYRPPEY